MANIKFEIILGMLFLKFSNMDMLFDKKILMWRTYTTNKTLLTTKRIQIINKKDFVIATLDANNETFVVHIAIWEREKMPVHFKKQT